MNAYRVSSTLSIARSLPPTDRRLRRRRRGFCWLPQNGTGTFLLRDCLTALPFLDASDYGGKRAVAGPAMGAADAPLLRRLLPVRQQPCQGVHRRGLVHARARGPGHHRKVCRGARFAWWLALLGWLVGWLVVCLFCLLCSLWLLASPVGHVFVVVAVDASETAGDAVRCLFAFQLKADLQNCLCVGVVARVRSLLVASCDSVPCFYVCSREMMITRHSPSSCHGKRFVLAHISGHSLSLSFSGT